MILRPTMRQQGLSLSGLIFILGIVALIAIFGMKVVPTAIEYNSIRGAIVTAKEAGTTPQSIRGAYDKLADTGYIESVKGRDLDIQKVDGELEVSFAYEKKFPIFGPASLLLEYAGSTAKTGPVKKVSE